MEIVRQSNFPPNSQSQEGETDHEECSAYASLETKSSSQSRDASININGDKVSSLLQRSKNQENLAQQQYEMLEQYIVIMDTILP